MTKKEKTERCKAILNSGIAIVQDKDDFDFLIDIFRQHTEWELKSLGNRPIKAILIRYSKHGTKCFYLQRSDNSITDISYIHCITPKSDDRNLQQACRTAIMHIKNGFRDRQTFPMKCPIEGIIIESPDDAHVDHYDLDFIEVYKKWVTRHGGISNLIGFVNKTEGNDAVTCFTNHAIEKDFIDFHNSNTHLRIISKRANLSIRKKNNNL